VSRYHEEQHFHGALMGLLLVAMVFVVAVTVVAVFLSRPGDALLLAIAPVVVVLVASSSRCPISTSTSPTRA
jgi:hypothetical protein